MSKIFEMWVTKYKYATEDREPGIVLSKHKPHDYGDDIYIPGSKDRLLISTNKNLIDKMSKVPVKINITIPFI